MIVIEKFVHIDRDRHWMFEKEDNARRIDSQFSGNPIEFNFPKRVQSAKKKKKKKKRH